MTGGVKTHVVLLGFLFLPPSMMHSVWALFVCQDIVKPFSSFTNPQHWGRSKLLYVGFAHVGCYYFLHFVTPNWGLSSCRSGCLGVFFVFKLTTELFLVWGPWCQGCAPPLVPSLRSTTPHPPFYCHSCPFSLWPSSCRF